MKNKQFITGGKKNPVRDYRSVETINATPTLQSVRTATKSRRLQTYGLQYKGWFFFYRAMQTYRLAFLNTIFYSLFIFCYLVFGI
jgi:hypothetical protein